MATKESERISHFMTFDPKKSIKRAGNEKSESSKWEITTSKDKITWGNRIERVAIIRRGLPYESIDVIGQKANLPIKQVLHYLGVAQTTYNK